MHTYPLCTLGAPRTLLRDLRAVSDTDPEHQQYAIAMADVLVDAYLFT